MRSVRNGLLSTATKKGGMCNRPSTQRRTRELRSWPQTKTRRQTVFCFHIPLSSDSIKLGTFLPVDKATWTIFSFSSV